ncbi:hypothetical protein N9M50_05990 [Alphaproteobacteria bacterium]|nr:hypothetical protein [Alphaproteobacteria bacterium]
MQAEWSLVGMPDLSSIGRAIIQLKWYGLDGQHNNNLSRRLSKTYRHANLYFVTLWRALG